MLSPSVNASATAMEVHVTPHSRHDELEIDQDIAFQQREWRAQRIGRFGLLVVIVLAVAGAFGAGPLSSATLRTPDGRLELDYSRIARHRSPEPLRIRIVPPAADTSVDLWINREYLHGLAVQRISPDPVRVTSDNERLVYRFGIANASRPAEVVFQVDADALWMRRGAIGFVGGDSITFRQFVLP